MPPNKALLESIVDEKWELIDPSPDIKQLFDTFNSKYFRNRLKNVEIRWNTRMVVSVGICRFIPPKECVIQLSNPLLRFRPRRDLVETILHEMIHAYLYIVDGDKEREEHGPKFMRNMKRINLLSGTNITVYHDFHEEIAYYQSHWWMCNGKCSNEAPNYGIIMKSIDRKPGPLDSWWKEHLKTCKGVFVKIKEPEKRTQKPNLSSLSKPEESKDSKHLNKENKKPRRKSGSLLLIPNNLQQKQSVECMNQTITKTRNDIKQKSTPLRKRRCLRSASTNQKDSLALPSCRKRSKSFCQNSKTSDQDKNQSSSSLKSEMSSSEAVSLGLKNGSKSEIRNADHLLLPTIQFSLEDDNVFEQWKEEATENKKPIIEASEFEENTTSVFMCPLCCLHVFDLDNHLLKCENQMFQEDTLKIPCPICRIFLPNDSMICHIEFCLSQFNISKPKC